MDADHRRALGRSGEDTAALLLEEAGLVVLERNWRGGRLGELDLIAEGPPGIVVVEVRTRIGDLRGSAVESIDARKVAKLRLLAGHWAAERGCRRRLRVDAIALALEPSRRDEILAALPVKDLRTLGARATWVRGIA